MGMQRASQSKMHDALTSAYKPQRITVDLIRELLKLDPPEKPREIRDKAAGLILRHQPSGYLGMYANLGRGKRERICNARTVIDSQSTWTIGKVRNRAKVLRGESAGGRDFAGERQAKRAIPTLSAYLKDTYGPWIKQNRRSGETSLSRLKTCFEDRFGNVGLDEIRKADVEAWRTKRQKQGRAPETINRDIAQLRAALSVAVRFELITGNPLLGVETAKVDRHKRPVRALTAKERSKLIEALEARDGKKREARASGNQWRTDRGYRLKSKLGQFADVLTPAVITSLETGLRRGELFALEWPSVDFGEKTLRVEGKTAKTYETREIPLNAVALKTLRDWWLQNGQPKAGFVFASNKGEQIGSLKKSYHVALKQAGIKRIDAKGQSVNWHSLRHTFGSLLGAANVDPTTLMRLMGHANLATTQRYLHSDEDRKREAVDRLTAAS